MTYDDQKKFSDELESWLKSKGNKTLGHLDDVFAENSFAIAILLLMAMPALPMPTGGLTHALEIITLILVFEIFVGRKQVWIPKRWRKLSLKGRFQNNSLRGLLKFIRFFEKFSSPRKPGILASRVGQMSFALIVAVFTIFAFIAPPFTGLDTLPSLGVVILCISLILKDSLIFVLGLLVGSTGVTLIIALGKAVYDGILRYI